jgi:hypothetical protein
MNANELNYSMVHIYNGLSCILVCRIIILIDYDQFVIELLQKMRLFVKAKQITKHCIEKEGIPLNYNAADYDGAVILATQAPTLKRLPAVASPTMSSVNKNIPPILKEFVCTIWSVDF